MNNMAQVNIKVLALALLLVIFITGTNGFSLTDGVCSYQKRERPGTVKFLVVGGIRESGTNGTCSSVVSRSTRDNLAVLNRTLDILNGDRANNVTFLPNMTIGYDLYDNCDSEDMTTDLLFSGYTARQNMSCSETANTSPVYIGVVSLTTPKATQLISRYTQPLPVLRPLMSAPSLHSSNYTNLLQTVVAFRQEALAITKMLTSIRWKYVALIHSEATRNEAEVFVDMAHAQGICLRYKGLPTNESITALYSALKDAYNKSIAVIYLGNPSGAIEFIKSAKNGPYLSSIQWVFTSHLASDNMIKTHTDDTITCVQYPDHSISDNSAKFLLQTDVLALNPYHLTDAVMVAVSAAKQVWDSVCAYQHSIDECPEFTHAIQGGQLLEKTKQGVNIREAYGDEYLPVPDYNRTVKFQDDGTQHYSMLELRFKKGQSSDDLIGRYVIGGAFKQSENIRALPTSAAGLDKHECLEKIDIRYSYIHGDVLLLGLFTVRNAGNSAFKCGLIRRGVNDIITVSSFFQSVLSRRRKSDKYTLGAIAIDDCYNGINTNEYLTALFSKKRFIRDPLTNHIINFDDVIVVIGALSSPVTLMVADLATSINISMLSYSASSPDLDNKNRYPYFLRTVPSDSLQVQGMIQVLVSLNVSHVGLLYIDDAYGKAGKIRLEEEARRFNICVEPPIRLTQSMTDEHVKNDVVNELYKQQVLVVLYFGIDTIATQILDAMDSSDRPFVFIASEAWGTNQKLIANSAGQKSKGSIVFNIETKSNDNVSYKAYLDLLNANQTYPNRWIPNYFEDYNGCYSIDSFEKPKNAVICPEAINTTLSSYSKNILYNDQRAVHTMNSVFAATESLKEVCANCSSGAIKKITDSFFQAMKRTLFKGTKTRMFDEDGNGNIGYTIYNIQMNTNISKTGETSYTAVYVPIGKYTKNGQLDLQKLALKFYDERHNELSLLKLNEIDKIHCSKYLFHEACSQVCPRVTTTIPTTVVTMEVTTAPPTSDGTWKTVAIAFVFGFCIVVFVLLVVLIRPCVIKQVSSDKGDSSGRTTSVSGSHSIYDEPGSLRRRDFDNLVFMPDSASLRSQPNTSGTLRDMHMFGSGISLNKYSPTQYSQIRQMSNPELKFHHIRQISNHEIRSHTFDTLERPMSTLSAPAYKPHARHSPTSKRLQHHGGKHKIGKQSFSPNTPHSAPTGDKKKHAVYRPRTQSSPRFRYPSTDESHYTLPKTHSNEEEMPKRKYGTSDDDVQAHHDVSDETLDTEAYLDIGTDQQEEEEPKLNYISAKDLMIDQSDEEESAAEEEGDTVQYADTTFLQTAPPSVVNSACPPSGLALNEREILRRPNNNSSLTSPSDNEVMNINFPPWESKQSANSQMQTKKSSLPNTEAASVGETIEFNRNSSITDVPDVIKHGLYEEDGVFII